VRRRGGQGAGKPKVNSSQGEGESLEPESLKDHKGLDGLS